MPKEENDTIAHLKKAIRNAESQLTYYRKRYGAIGAPPSVTPYLKLATIYRKQKNYQAEVEVLERFVKRIRPKMDKSILSNKAQGICKLD